MFTLHDALLLKEQCGDLKVLYVTICGEDFVFRPLTPVEYTKSRILTTNTMDFHDLICQLTVLHPADYSFASSPYGGLSDVLGEQILTFSLLNDKEMIFSYFEYCRVNLNSFITQCTLFIKAAFPEFDLYEIESWDYFKLMDMVAKAEYILKMRGINFKLEYNLDDLDDEMRILSDKELLNQDIDPMLYNNYDTKKPFVDFPIIFGHNWKDEERIKDVREQIYTGREFRRRLQRPGTIKL